MKKKVLILNSLLIFAVLFAMLFQSLHSYEHFEEQLSEKVCSHKHISKHEITHQHHNFDHCFVCNFTLSHFISTDFTCFDFNNTAINFGYTLSKSKEITQFFKGSLFALRAPPSFIV